MTTYVINPITNELESAQPRQRVADKFKLEDLLTPGPLRDELKGDFDPTQETYEEYLRRINLRYGGRATPKRGLVDEPGSYSVKGYRAPLTQEGYREKGYRAPLTKNEKKIVASWQKRIGDKIGVNYDDLPHKLQFEVRQGINVFQQKLNPVKNPGAYEITDLVNKKEFKKFYKENYFDNPDSTFYKKEFKNIESGMKGKVAKLFREGKSDFQMRFFPDRGTGKEILDLYNKQLDLYGEPNLSSIARKVFPEKKLLDGLKQVSRVLKKYTSYDRKRDPKKEGTGEKRRAEKFFGGKDKISNKALEAELSASRKSGIELQHADALKKRNVTLNNLTYLPKPINAYLSTTEGFLRRKEKEVVDLLKNKPKNYKQKISSLNSQALNKMFLTNQKLVEAGFPMFKDSLDFYTFDENGKPIQLGGRSGQRFGTIVAEQLGLDPNKPIKNFSAEEIVKAREAKNILINETKKMYDDAIKRGADPSSFEKIKFVTKQANDMKKNPTKFLKDLGMNSKDITKFNKAYGGIPFLDPELLKGVLSEFFKGDFTLDASTTQLGKGALGKSASALKNIGKALFKVFGVAALPLEAVYIKGLYDKGKTTAEMVGSPLLLTGRIAEAQDLMKMSPVERQAVSEQQIAGDESMLDTDFYTPMLEGRDEVDVESVRERVAKEREAEEASRILERGILEDLDNQVSTSLAQGGRVGFQNGTPPVIQANEPDYSELQVMLDNPNEYNTFPKGTFAEEMDKAVYGTDEERNLLQQFNTLFLDPRSYPYYTQKIARGAANIPEFLFKGVPKAGAAFIKDLYKNAGITKGGVEEILEALDPSITRDILEGKFGDLLGISPKAIGEEKRTGPQRITGSLLELAGELPGPATPIFLLGYAPKLLKQLKDIGAGAATIDKINKEIENKVATQGVNQTRRDIILSIGAGGAVAFLKYLGLDFLSKAPKAAPEIITKGGTPKYFFDFVSLIKRKGKDISDTAATVERQKVYDYNGYTLYEDLSTGKIRVTKENEGSGSYYVGDGEYDTYDGIVSKEEINYEPPETIIDDAGKSKKTSDFYEEGTLLPDVDGSEGDVEAGLESIDQILELLAKDGTEYTTKELEEMGIKIPQKDLPIRSDKAEGGIIAGVKSGPAPKSGPTPHGLPYLAKNVTPIKERK